MEYQYERRLGVSHLHRDENQETVGCHGPCGLSWWAIIAPVGYHGSLWAIIAPCGLSWPLLGYHRSSGLS